MMHRTSVSLLRAALVLIFACGQLAPVCAHEVHGTDAMVADPGAAQAQGAASQSAVETAGKLDLDLSSRKATIDARSVLNGAEVSINIGRSTRTVTASDVLTPAQVVAAMQVLSGADQSIVLNRRGRAIGGTVTITQQIAASLNSLVIPKGVTAIQDFGTTAALDLAGNLSNSGTFQAVSTNAAVDTASISASNIFNQAGALLTSVLPAAGLPAISGAVSSLNLNLTAVNDIINAGTISSSGNLALNAGGSIVNQATVSAAQSINLASATGNIVNSGLISAAAGQINIASQTVQNILINNVGGTFEALSGQINVRDALFDAKADLFINGGDLLAQELNLYGGRGKVQVSVDDLVGTVNFSAHDIKVAANTPNLVLGTITATGDPLISNQGNVTVSAGQAVSGAPLTYVARDDILVSGNDVSIDTGSASGDGGAILMVAGADFTINGTDLEITGASTTGGRIDLNVDGENFLASLDSKSTFAGGSGGDITLVAFAGSATDSGTIFLPSTAPVTTVGSGAGANGNVTVLAEADTDGADAITIGSINSLPVTFGTGGGGDIILATAAVDVVNGPVTIDNTGMLVSGSFAPDASSLPNASITIGAPFTSTATGGGDVTILAGNSIDTNDTSIFTNPISGDAGDITLIALNGSISVRSLATQPGNGSGGNILVAAGSEFQASSQVRSSGGLPNGNAGNINILTGTDIQLSDVLQAFAFEGNAGNILAVGGVDFTYNGAQLTITGGSLTGGSVSVGEVAAHVFNGGPGNGGSATIVAFEGSGTNSGRILLDPGSGSIQTFGGGSGNNDGSILVIAGDDDEGALTFPGQVITTVDATGAAGSITVATATPLVSPGGVVIEQSSGSVVSGSFSPDLGLIQPSSINASGAFLTNGGDINIHAGAGIALSSGVTASRSNGAGDGGNVVLTSGSGSLTTVGVQSDTFSTGSGGNILIAGAGQLSVGFLLARAFGNGNGGNINVVAGQDIIAGSVTTSASNGNAGDILMVAGAVSNYDNSNLLVTGESSTGGRLDANPSILQVFAATGDGDGGDITLVAFEGTIGSPTSGQIEIGNVAGEIATGGSNNGNDGNILLIAGDSDQGNVSVSIGNTIATSGTATGTGGSVTIATATPAINGGSVVINAASGGVTGSFSPDLTNIQPTSVAIDPSGVTEPAIRTHGGNVTVIAGAGITTNNRDVRTTRDGLGGDGGDITLITLAGPLDVHSVSSDGALPITGANGGNVLLASGGSMSLGGNVTASATSTGTPGNINIIAGGDVIGTSSSVLTQGINHDSGNILIVAGGAFTYEGADVTVTGESTTGGQITGLSQLNTNVNGSSGSGGDLTLIAFEGISNTPDSGRIVLNDLNVSNPIDTRGVGSANSSGNILMIAGDDDGGTLTISQPINNFADTATGGGITLVTTTPKINGGVVINQASGLVTSGSFSPDFDNIQNGEISTQSVSTNGAPVTMVAAGGITTNNSNVTTGRIVGSGVGGDVTLVALSGSISLGTGFVSTSSSSATATTSGNILIAAGTTLVADIFQTSVSSSGPNAGNINVVAGSDIGTVSQNVGLFANSTTNGNAGNILAIAGAQFTYDGSELTVTSGSLTGGTLRVSNPSTSSSLGSRGFLNLVAFAGNQPGSGELDLVTSGIDANSVQLIAGGVDNSSISVNGTITTTGGPVVIARATPTFGDGDIVINQVSGLITSGSVSPVQTAIQDGSISTGTILTQGGDITLLAGTDVATGNLSANELTAGEGGDVTVVALSGSISITGSPGTVSTAGLGGDSGTILLLAGTDASVGALITAPVSSGNAGNVNVLAGGNITLGLSVQSHSPSGHGGNIFLASGADFTFDGATVTVIGESASGGKIGGSAHLASNAGGSAANGGHIIAVAFEGTSESPDSGTIVLGMTESGGSGTGNDGSIVIVAGNDDAPSVLQVSQTVSTVGGSGMSGSITVAAATPLINDGPIDIDVGTGNIASGSVSPDLSALQDADLTIGNLTTNGGDVGVFTAGGISTGPLTDVITSRLLGPGSDGNIALIALGGDVTRAEVTSGGGNILIAAGGDIGLASASSSTASGDSAGSINIVAGGNFSFNSAFPRSLTSESNSQGGNVLLVAGASFTFDGSVIEIVGESTTGGQLNLSNPSALTTVSARATATGGDAGDVTLIAFEGSIGSPDSGTILGTSLSIRSSGQGTGDDGNMMFIAGDNNGATLALASSSALFNTNDSDATGSGGSVTIATATPQLVGGSVTISASTGSVTGSFAPDANALQPSSITTEAIKTNGADITVLAGNDVVPASLFAPVFDADRNNGTGDAGNISITAQAGSVNLAGRDISNESATGAGGLLDIASGLSIAFAQATAGGSITLNAGTTISSSLISGTTIDLSAGTTISAIAINGTTIDATAGTSLQLNGPVNGSNITLTTPVLSATFAVTATTGTLLVQSPANQTLTIEADTIFTAGSGITFTASAPFLTFDGAGTLVLASNTEINAPLGVVAIASGTTVVRLSNNVTVNTCVLDGTIVGTGPGTVTVNMICPPGVGGGTIANSNGDINLTSNLLINTSGLNLAIIASGNVFTTDKLKAVSLFSSLGDGGNLTIMAGFDFIPATSGQEFDTTTPYMITGPSASGGSVLLPKVALNTSTSAASAGARAGDITIVASAGTENSGQIVLGSLNAGAKSGEGGNIQLIGAGGIEIGGSIDTSGSVNGGTVELLGSQPQPNGPLAVFNGFLLGGVGFQSSAPQPGAGALITVTGSINTSSAAGTGGSVTIATDSNISVGKGGITTSGLAGLSAAGGMVAIVSTHSSVSIAGTVNTSAFDISSGNSDGAAAGDIEIDAAGYVSIAGSLLADGGSNTKGVGASGGHGGTIRIETSDAGANGNYVGQVLIRGGASATGGSVVAGGNNGGDGGEFEVTAGTLVVLGKVGNASINTSAGTGNGSESDGSVTIATFATQPLPRNFDLTSTDQSEVALPGGLFQVGVKSAFNGTAADIVNGDAAANNANAGSLDAGSGFNQGGIQITVVGGARTIDEGPVDPTFSPGELVTPGEALALFQVSRGDPQTVGLNSSGQVILDAPGGGDSQITIRGLEFAPNNRLTAFNARATQFSPSQALTINIAGETTFIDLTSAKVIDIQSQINLNSGNSTTQLAVGKNSPVINGAAITSQVSGRIVISGSPKAITITGSTVIAGKIEIRNAKAITITGSPVIAGKIEISSPKSISLVCDGVTSIGGPSGMPGTTLFVSDNINVSGGQFVETTVMARAASTKSKSFVISSDFLQGAELGSASFPTIRVNSLASSDLTIADNAVITATKSLDITSGGDLTIGNGVTIGGQGKAKTVNIVSNGHITISNSGTFSIASGRFLMLAAETITGGTDNQFLAGGNNGGGIMLGSNITDVKAAQTTLSNAFKLAPGTAPPVAELGEPGVTIINGGGTTGVIQRIPPVGGGTIDLTSSGTQQANLNATSGAMVFDVNTPGASIQFDGVTITVDDIVPIAYRPGIAPVLGLSVESHGRRSTAEPAIATIGHVFIEGSDRAEALTATMTGGKRAGKGSATIKVLEGAMLFHALLDTAIKTEVGTVRIDRGALVSVQVTAGTMRVGALSGPGHITVLAGQRRIQVAPGREVFVSDHDMTYGELVPRDGVGRRLTRRYKLGNGLSMALSGFSIVSMLTSASHTRALRHPPSSIEHGVVQRLIKTAAAVRLMTVHRGAYTARPVERPGVATLTPVQPRGSSRPLLGVAL